MRTSSVAHEFDWPLWDRIRTRCEWQGECFVWQGHKTAGGYGVIGIERGAGAKTVYVHRAAYEHVHGPIGDGFVIDHVRSLGCRSRACCNVAHLESVTVGVNTLRGDGPSARNARTTHCPKGHPLSGDNVFLRPRGRECRTCHLAGCIVRAQRQRERQLAARRAS